MALFLTDASRAVRQRYERERRRAEAEARQAGEEREKAAEVEAIAVRGLPVDGSPGEQYIRHTRALQGALFINAPVRWDPIEHALAFLVTDVYGSVCAVQHVALTKDGEKDKRYYRGSGKGRESKNTIGPKSRGVVRFPAKPSDRGEYLLVGEGPETTWAANEAVGYESWASLGGIHGLGDFDIRGRVIVALRDDDAVTSGAYRAAEDNIRKLRAAGHQVIEVFPFEIRRENGDDFNTLAQESGIDTVRDRINQAICIYEKIHQFIEFPLTKANELLNKYAKEFFSDVCVFDREDQNAIPKTISPGVTLGVGKSYAFQLANVDHLIANHRNGIRRVAVIATPQHLLSDEQAETIYAMFKERGADHLRAGVYRGREANNPDGSGEKMCRNIEEIRKANSHLVKDIEGEVCDPCPFRPNCAYMAQRDADYDFVIVNHSLLFSEPPPAVKLRGVDSVVIDEAHSFIQTGMIGVDGDGITIPLDRLLRAGGMAYAHGPDGERLVAIRVALSKALMDEPDGYVSMNVIRAAGFDFGTADFAQEQEWLRRQDKRHHRDWRNWAANADLHRMAMLWQIISKGMNDGVERLGHLRMITTPEGVRMLHLYGRKDVWPDWAHAPTALISALHKPDLIAYYYPAVEDLGFLSIEAPYQRIRQVTGDNWAKSYLGPGESDEPKKALAKQNKLRRAKAIVLRESAAIGGQILLVAPKIVIQALKQSGLPSNIKTAHFNATAGRNVIDGVDGRNFDGVIILGSINPPIDAMERAAAALTGLPPKTLSVGGTKCPQADANRFLRRGKSIVSIPAQDRRHPDDLVEALRRLITEGEIEQALGRGRGVRRREERPLKVTILSNAVLPFPVDEIVQISPKDISHRDLMLAEGGVAFEDGTSAAKAYPGLYPSAGSARKALHDERAKLAARGALLPLRDNSLLGAVTHLVPVAGLADEGDDLLGRSLSLALFQREGVGQRPQRAVFDPGLCPDLQTFLEAAIGPLACLSVELKR